LPVTTRNPYPHKGKGWITMPDFKVADKSQLPLPAAVPTRHAMMRGYGIDLKDRVVIEDPSAQDAQSTLTVEQVAHVVAGIPLIGWAHRALEAAGWHATIAGNRITVSDEVFAQFVPASAGQFGHINASWVIYLVAGTPPVWIVGAEPDASALGPISRDFADT
jgi:hypothetical protein